jgi:MazG family protein
MARPFAPVEVPPLPSQQGATTPRLVELMQRLLAPDGCPWDREQSHASIRKYVIEEACEVADAIDSGDDAALCEELGDLALQVVFHAELARARGAFGPDDVIGGVCEKLVRRHPHVFADVTAEGSDEVLRNWERIKLEEKAAAGKPRGLLGGVPRSLPSVVRAQRVGEKASRVGFDWPDGVGARAKVDEEMAELDRALAAGDRDAAEGELGDALFALINVARHAGIDADAALRRSIDKYVTRFAHVESRVGEVHGGWPERGGEQLPLEELDRYWDEAKAAERR